MMVPDPVSAAQIEWAIVQTEIATGSPASPKPITCTASDTLTRISGPHETTLIDYRGARIFRLDSTDSTCRVYPFGRPHAELPAAAWAVAPADDASAVRHVSFGMHSAIAQTMTMPVPRVYGQEFPLCQAEFRISRTLPGFVYLLGIAAGHREIFQEYPILRRVDPIGLLEPLGGFPVSGSCHSPLGKTTMQMVSPPAMISTPISLPQNCLTAY